MIYIVAICLFLSLCAIVVSLYFAVQLRWLIKAQANINDWAEDSLVNHKNAIEQQIVVIRNHGERILDILNVLNMDGKIMVKYDDNYSEETN